MGRRVSEAVIEIAGLRKHYHGLRPLRVDRFVLYPSDRVVISGFDAAAAEVFQHLVTGASLPDEGDVRVFGKNTREIATDTEWLASLDRFGLITARAVLLESMPLCSNLALPFTVAIDPIPADVLARVERLADEVGLARDRLSVRAGDLTPEERLRIHLARALAPDPLVLLLEHPTASVAPDAAVRFGETLRRVSDRRRLAWVALSEDVRFARAAGGATRAWAPATGQVRAVGFWRKMFST